MGNLFTPDMVKGALQQQQQSAPQIPAQEELEIGGSNDSQLPFFANPDAASQPQRIQPGQPLKAGATVNVNPAELALRSSILGFLETPEMLANAAGSVAQQGVPVEQRTTAADWLHSLGIPQSPGEILQSPEYRAQVQSAGLPGQVADIGGQLGGGFLFPMGVIGAGGKLLAKGAQMIPGVAKAAGPIAAGVGKAMPALQKLMPQGKIAQAAVKGAATGAGYGMAFGQGRKFGQTKQNMNPQEAAFSGTVGGGLGAGLGSGVAKISQMLSGRAAQMAGAAGNAQAPAQDFFSGMTGGGNYSPKTTGNMLEAFIAKNPEQGQRAIQVAAKRTAKRGPEYRDAVSDVQKRAALRENREAQQTERFNRTTQKQEKNFSRNRIFKEKDARERREFAKLSKEEQRAYTEKQNALKRNERRQERADSRNDKLADLRTKESKAGSRTNSSNEYYGNLFDKIRSADSAERLTELEKRIYSSPEAKDGSRLLDNDQRQNLARQLRARISQLKKEKKAEPGESEGHQQAEPVAPAKKTAAPAKKEPASPAPPEQKGVSTGDFRKMIKNREKPRERRHEGAVSAEKMAASAKFAPHEKEAFKDAVDQLAEAHVEIKYATAEMEALAEWGLKNPEAWKNPSANFKTMETADGMMVAKAGASEGFLLRAKVERMLTKAQQQAISKYRDKLVREGIERGDIEPRLQNDHLEVTVGGKADYAEITDTGRLKVVGMQKIAPPSREMPKSVQEMYERIERIRGRIASHRQVSEEIKEDVLPLAQKIFEENKTAWAATEHAPAEIPSFNVFHKDEYGHVTTITFKQGSLRHDWNEATADLKAKLDALHEKFIAESKSEQTFSDVVKKSTRTMYGFTGMEPIILGVLAGKSLGKMAAQLTKANEQSALFVGTIRDILKAHPQYMGDKIANKFDEINGRILEGFAVNGHRMVRIGGGEDLTELLNKFKGVPADQIMFAKVKGVTQAERETAAFFRKNYKELADTIKPVLEEMKAREKDIQFGIQEGRKYGAVQLENGSLRRDAHSKLAQEAMQQMYDAALLKGKHWEMAASGFASLLNRKNSSIFANNPKVGLANFIDPLPMTLVEFGRHWMKASIAVGRKEVRDAINKLPVVPQADLNSIEMQQRKLIAKTAPTNVFEKAADLGEEVNEFLGNKLDFLFKGKEKLTGLADKRYTRTALVASIYRQAKMRGMDGNDLLDAILLGKKNIHPGLRSDVWKAVAGDMSQLFNTLNPTLNRDLFADSMVGKMFGAYSRPQRRVGRYMYNLMKGDAKDKTKFVAASFMYLGLGGRAILPTSVRNLIIYGGSMGLGYQAKDAVAALQNLDNANALEKLTGWDLSDRISYDAANLAAPTLEDLSGLVNDISSVRNGESAEGKLFRVSMRMITSLALVPKVAGVGVGYLNSGANSIRYAAEGSRPLYVTVGGVTKKVPIPYDFNDAFRDFILAGPNPKAKSVKPAVERVLADRIDAKRNSLRSILIPSAAAE